MNEQNREQRRIDRFWTKVQKTESCWLWTGTKLYRANGYICGGISMAPAVWARAHHFSYELAYGKLPEGARLRFACENTLCVNPAHLIPITMADRFWQKVVRADGGCWGWRGTIGKGGYGRLQRDGKNNGLVYAHRYSWELHNGPIPDNMLVLHRCDNPPCANPEHLFLGSDQDNSDDMVQKGRGLAGHRHRNAKLSNAQVLEIRASTERPEILASRYPVSASIIYNIRARRIWRHI